MALSIILVICSGLAHAVWNLFAKQSTDKSAFLWAIYAPSTLLLAPHLISELLTSSYDSREWLLLGASLAMQSLYAALLSFTYANGDLSQVYPIMRGVPTLLTPLLGVLILGEAMPAWGWIGILFMLAGFFVMLGPISVFLVNRAVWLPIGLAVAVGLCIATYTVIDKASLQFISALSLLEVTNIGFLLGLTPAAMQHGRLKRAIRKHGRIIGLGALLSPGSYLLFLLAAQQAAVSIVAPLREIGIVFATLLGLLVLKEAQGRRRITAAVAVATGIMIISIIA